MLNWYRKIQTGLFGQFTAPGQQGGSVECVELTAGWLDPILKIGNGPILVNIRIDH